MRAPTITLTGNLAAAPVLRRTANDVPYASFRVANTPRRLDRATGAWNDQPTTWFSVTCWRHTAEHVVASLKQGDRVVVVGQLSTSTWTGPDGEQRQGLDVEASCVGPDLSRAPARVVTAPPLQVDTDPGDRPLDEHGEDPLEALLDDGEPALAAAGG